MNAVYNFGYDRLQKMQNVFSIMFENQKSYVGDRKHFKV